MVFRYYGINTSKIEIFYNIGGGYAQGYGFPPKRALGFPIRKPPVKYSCTGDLSLGTDDYKFLASLYGCSFDFIDHTLVVNKNKCWEEYWENIKYYVSQDIPVLGIVDPLSWPPYREFFNVTTKPSIFFRSCCVIVIVGFNESNNTVCFHDQYVGYENASKKGMYQWIDLDTFNIASGRGIWDMKETRYQIFLIKKISDPLSSDLINELVHKRNILKMKGITDVYDNDFIKNNYNYFGINALKELKNDINTDLRKMLPLYRVLFKILPFIEYPFSKMIKDFSWEALNKLQISQYMSKNQNIPEKYADDIRFLTIESRNWYELENLTIELKNKVFDNKFNDTKTDSNDIIDNMVNVIDDIINIQKMIILTNE